jgi:phosphatidylserine decarboxylase
MGAVFVALQYLLPHHLLCRLVHALTRVRTRWVKDALIGAFMRAFRPDMHDAQQSEPLQYESFNAFFTRALKTGTRPLDPQPDRIVSPCDGTLSIAGKLDADRMVQAKGHSFALKALLAGDAPLSERLRDGRYTTIYLAPYNYHRLHMPLAGRLRSAWHVPGRIFSVNNATVARVPGLFARNERVVCVFDGEQGPFVLVLVGALFVGSMSTVWHGEVTPWHRARHAPGPAPGTHGLTPLAGVPLQLERGAEFARFNMGSTIVMLMSAGMGEWDSRLQPGMSVRVGQGLGSLLPASRIRAPGSGPP